MKGSNAKQNKSINLRLVLAQIVTQGPISRVEIARNTQLTKQTITNMVEELLSVQLVEETGIKKSEGAGKPSKMLVLNKKAAYTLAVRIVDNELEVGLFYLNGELLNRLHTQLDTNDTPLDKVKYLIDTLLTVANLTVSQVLGCGLSVQLSHLKGVEIFAHNRQLQQQLADTLAVPVALETTASACASFQMLFGEARLLDSFVYVHLGNQVESAVVYDRRILLGQNGLTGALGDLFVTPETDDDTAELGRLNDFASLTALKQHLGRTGCSTEELHHQLQEHPVIDRWLEQAAEPMRIAIHSIESLLNTQTIILGGDINDWLLDKLTSELRPFIPSIAQFGERQVVRLVKTPDVANIALKGVATLPLHSALSAKNMQTLYFPALCPPSELQELVY